MYIYIHIYIYMYTTSVESSCMHERIHVYVKPSRAPGKKPLTLPSWRWAYHSSAWYFPPAMHASGDTCACLCTARCKSRPNAASALALLIANTQHLAPHCHHAWRNGRNAGILIDTAAAGHMHGVSTLPSCCVVSQSACNVAGDSPR